MIFFLLYSIFHILYTSPSFAQETQSSKSPTINVTVPDEVFTPPELISPVDESAVNSSTGPFVFTTATSTAGIDHYDLYIDDIVVAGGISNNDSSQDAYYYSKTKSGSRFYITLKNNLTNAYHSWKIIAYRNTNHTSTTTSWQFWVDTVSPQITLEKIGQTKYSWDSRNTSQIPTNRNLVTDQQRPTLNGNVEPYANFKITFSDQTNTTTYPDGHWTYTINTLKPNQKYSIYLTATDSAGNTTTFPTFTITFVPQAFAILTTSPAPVTTEPSPINISSRSIAETFPYTPPPKPYPPPIPQLKFPSTIDKAAVTTDLTLIASAGLFFHLLFAIAGAGVKISMIPKLLCALIIPPLSHLADDLTLAISSKGNLIPLPFTTLTLLSLEPLKKQINQLKTLSPSELFTLLHKTKNLPTNYLLTGTLGTLNLTFQKGSYYIIPTHLGYSFQPNSLNLSLGKTENIDLYRGQIITVDEKNLTSINHKEWLFPLSENSHYLRTVSDCFRNIIMKMRVIPLIISFILSVFLLYFDFNIFISTLSLFCLLLLFNQYLYSKLRCTSIKLYQ